MFRHVFEAPRRPNRCGFQGDVIMYVESEPSEVAGGRLAPGSVKFSFQLQTPDVYHVPRSQRVLRRVEGPDDSVLHPHSASVLFQKIPEIYLVDNLIHIN